MEWVGLSIGDLPGQISRKYFPRQQTSLARASRDFSELPSQASQQTFKLLVEGAELAVQELKNNEKNQDKIDG